MIANKKTYYSIREVCDETGLEPHVLRYWEKEFSQLKPKKNRGGNRAYRNKDITLIKDIKHLLYVEKYTIEGAQKKLKRNTGSVNTGEDSPEVLKKTEIRSELESILDILDR